MNDSASLIHVEDLHKTYGGGLLAGKGFEALRGVSLDVGRGSVFGLLGPNGAGKTTLIKILLGLARKSGGKAELFGQPAGRTAPRRRIGYLPEAHRLPGYLTGRQVLELFGMMCGRSRTELRARIPAMLELVGMSDSAERKVREYSKGMQQRIGLAQAMVHDPELIFLDEPTDGVDPVGRAAIREVVLQLKRRGVSIFINSHLLMEVEMICDRVVIMDKGRIIRDGSIEELTPRTGRLRFEVAPVPEDPTQLEKLVAGIGIGYQALERGFEIQVTDEELDQLVDRLRGASLSIRSMNAHRVSLEQAFIDLVRKELKA